MGLFNCPHNLDQTALVESAMETIGDGSRSARVAAASIRSDDQNTLCLDLGRVAQPVPP